LLFGAEPVRVIGTVEFDPEFGTNLFLGRLRTP